MKTDRVLRKMASASEKPRFAIIPKEDEGAALILIDGSARSIKNIGELLIGIAEESEGQDFDLSLDPRGAGNKCVDKNSLYGIYINVRGDSKS